MIQPSTANAKILVVEDEGIVALDISNHLEGMGYVVLGTAATGEDAIRKAEQLKPDLVLMDIKLRGKMDGIQAADMIRVHSKIPIIFLTAYADKPTLQRAKISEPYGYVLKPFEDRELLVAIEMALYKNTMERRLRESENRLRSIFNAVLDGVFVLDKLGNILDVNPAGCSMFGYTRPELLENNWETLVSAEDLEKFKNSKMMVNGLLSGTNEFRVVHRSGAILWVEMNSAVLEGSEDIHMVGVMRDITSRKRAEEQLLHDAFHDALTGLPNRSLFIDRLERAIQRGRRYENAAYAVLLLDLDRFKVINDSLGHQAGDQLLKQVAERLTSLLRASDTLARFGGDEFAILLEEFSTSEEAIKVAERIQEDLKRPFLLTEQTIVNSTSIGIVVGGRDYERSQDVLRDADIAMYKAKAAGKAQHVLFRTDFRERAITLLELEGDLRLAQARGELHVFYQPIFNLIDGKIAGFEALLRWFHPQRGLIPPSDFIPLAEETGLIHTIGTFVLREACKQLVEWQAKFPLLAGLSVSVNLSGKQLNQPDLPEQVSQVLQETGMDAHNLKLELTENQLIDNSPSALAALEKLRQLGLQLLVDDFGVGYSSLSYVQQFPIDTIKIDRIFVNRLQDGEARRAEIVQTIIQLAHELQLGTIAEGIETPQQLLQLKALSCEYGQGWLFSKAQGKEAIERILQASIPFNRPDLAGMAVAA